MIRARWTITFGLLLACLAWTPTRAEAQGLCSQACDPWTTPCTESCTGCFYDYPDGYCPQQDTYSTTCGEYAGACIREGCTPSWVQQTKTQIGAWKSCWGVYCNYYHSFDIRECDSRQCNINSSFYCRNRCTNEKKGYYGGNSCDCCSIFSNLGGCWGYRCG